MLENEDKFDFGREELENFISKIRLTREQLLEGVNWFKTLGSNPKLRNPPTDTKPRKRKRKRKNNLAVADAKQV